MRRWRVKYEKAARGSWDDGPRHCQTTGLLLLLSDPGECGGNDCWEREIIKKQRRRRSWADEGSTRQEQRMSERSEKSERG